VVGPIIVNPAAPRARFIAGVVIFALAACRSAEEPRHAAGATPTPTPEVQFKLPDDQAGKLVARAIEATGGWERWRARRDVAFVSTLTLYDRIGNAVSETIMLHKSPLHAGMKTRVESIGLTEEIVLGVDGHGGWMLHDGKAVSDPLRTAFTRFNALSNHYWFGLPFVLAEGHGNLRYLGSEPDGRMLWEKVRVDFSAADAAPADWLVLYIDADTGLPGRVLGHVTAEFLRHPLWMAKLRDYREWEGIKKERRRTFFPADEDGHLVGPMAAEQLVEHVRFDNDFPRSLFVKPLAAGGGSPAG
jgi:hypothetical protein